MIDYTNFKKSLKNLEAQYKNYTSLDETLPLITQEAVAESVIHRFEICWDCLWKVLKRYLTEEIGITDVPNSSKPIVRIAAENLLLPSDTEQWLKYADARIGTTHDYSGEKAQDALDMMEYFIEDAIEIYQTMSKETWE